jgi:hypothetical protein
MDRLSGFIAGSWAVIPETADRALIKDELNSSELTVAQQG